MSGRFVTALIVSGLGLLIVLTPWYIFPVCVGMVQTVSGAAVHMKCFWAGVAASSAGGVIAAGGLFMGLFRSPGIRAGIALMLVPAGLYVALIPSFIIGVCPGETMPCHIGTLPALLLPSVLAILVGAAGAVGLRKEIQRDTRF